MGSVVVVILAQCCPWEHCVQWSTLDGEHLIGSIFMQKFMADVKIVAVYTWSAFGNGYITQA